MAVAPTSILIFPFPTPLPGYHPISVSTSAYKICQCYKESCKNICLCIESSFAHFRYLTTLSIIPQYSWKKKSNAKEYNPLEDNILIGIKFIFQKEWISNGGERGGFWPRCEHENSIKRMNTRKDALRRMAKASDYSFNPTQLFSFLCPSCAFLKSP